MEITVNSQPKTVKSDSLHELLQEMLGEKTRGIAVAINQNIIPKTEWSSATLKEKDNLLIIKATQGG
jgi:sulfur carrier protein